MGGIVQNLFGGGSAKKQAAEAAKKQEESQQLQRVANDRQMAEVNRNKQAVGATRRAPRGRRLFEDGGADAGGSSAVLA
jgi:hypothetical protein